MQIFTCYMHLNMKRLLCTYLLGLFVIYDEAYSCTSDSTQYKRIGNSADLQFKASTNNGQSLPILVYNFIISPNGTSMLLAKYKIDSNTYIIDCKGCTFTGNVTTGNLTIRLDNLEKSNGGTYKHAVHTFDNVLRCVHVYILGTPTQPSVSVTSSPSVGGSASLTCTSISTTTPSNHSLGFMYNWQVDSTDNPSDSRYSYSTNSKTLTLSNIVKDDAKKQFTCTATEDVSNGYTSSRSDPVSFDVHYGPEDVDFSPKSTAYERHENTNLETITCTASCNPACNFRWTKVGDDTFVTTSAVLSLGMLSRSMTGTYRCMAMRTGGSNVTKDLIVNVTYLVVQHFYVEEHRSQTSVTVDERDDEVEFKCFVDSNTASYTTIIFEGDVIKEGVNATSISVVLRDISCYDAGVYICEGRTYGGQISRRNITLLVNCSPRPRRQVEGNVTTELHSSLTLSFSAIAYPEPGPKGFAWYKEAGVGWFPLLSNEDLRISSSGLQSNLTLLNVSRGDYGHYKVIVTNIIATYVQHLFMSEKMDHREIVKENECKKTDNTTLVLGLILGTVCCVLAIYATYLTIWKKRHLNIGRKPPGSSTNKSTYANTSIDSDAVKRQECESVKTQNQESYAHQYSDLSLYTNTDRNTYDVINKT